MIDSFKKHDLLVRNIANEIISQIKKFDKIEKKKIDLDLPENDEYYSTPKIFGEKFDFYIKLYLFKTNSDQYKIDADAPADLEENDIRVIVYYNPKNFIRQQNEIKNNLIYTLRHEYEHFIQVVTDYESVTYPKTHKYKFDSLKNLLKKREIEPQVRGYFLQSQVEKKPMDLVIKDHLAKLEKNKQIEFLGPERKEIVISTLINYARALNLPVKTSKL